MAYQPKHKRLAIAALELGLSMPQLPLQSTPALDRFNADQLDYIQQRASAYQLEASDIIKMMDPEIACNANAAIAKLKACELSHVSSQLNSPQLAHEPSNIVLEVADGTNQARGASDMSHIDILDVELRSEVQDAQILSDHPLHLDYSSAKELFNSMGQTVLRTVYVSRYVEYDTYRETMECAQSVCNDLPFAADQAIRDRIIDRVTDHIANCFGKADLHSAYLMSLLLSNAPWAVSFLSAKGLCTLGKETLQLLKHWTAQLFRDPRLAWCRQFFHDTLETAQGFLQKAEELLEAIWSGIEQAACGIAKATAAIVGAVAKPVIKAASAAVKTIATAVVETGKVVIDLVKTVHRKTTQFIRNVWSGFCWLFGKPSFA